MEATPEGQPEILRIRDDILMRDLPATPSPQQAAPPRPAITAPKKRKAKSTTETAQEKKAAKSAKSAGAVAARAGAAAQSAVDNIPGRSWQRHALFKLFPGHDPLQLIPELAETHGRWKRMLGKIKATVKENNRLRQLKSIIRRCKEKRYVAISIVEACLEEDIYIKHATSIAARAMKVGTRTIDRWRSVYKQNGGE
jgi:hypothetical protein